MWNRQCWVKRIENHRCIRQYQHGLVACTPRLPSPGETLTGYTFQTFPGGKGGNQAVACACLGAKTFILGRVGGDVFSMRLKEELGAAGVDHENVVVDSSISSGMALIAVEDSTENMIIVIPGANGQVGELDLQRLEGVFFSVKNIAPPTGKTLEGGCGCCKDYNREGCEGHP